MDIDGTLLHTRSSPLPLTHDGWSIYCSSKMTTSGRFADSHGQTGHEPNLINSQFVVAWADTQKNLMERKLAMDRFFINPSLEKFT